MTHEPGSRVSVAAVLAVLVAAFGVGAVGLAATAWVLLDRAPATPTAQTVSSAVTDAGGDGWRPWATNADGRPVRWDPCGGIDLVVNPDGLPDGVRDALDTAVADVAAAAGIRIRVAAEVDEQPRPDRALHQVARYGDRWAPVLVAAAAPRHEELPLRDVDRAIAIPVAVGPPGEQVFVSGQIVVNAERDDIGTGDRAGAWGPVLRHELGHLLGLDHVDDPEQLMYPYPVPGTVDLGDGDRRGLEALGAGDCLEVPPPGPVEVDVTEPGHH